MRVRGKVLGIHHKRTYEYRARKQRDLKFNPAFTAPNRNVLRMKASIDFRFLSVPWPYRGRFCRGRHLKQNWYLQCYFLYCFITKSHFHIIIALMMFQLASTMPNKEIFWKWKSKLSTFIETLTRVLLKPEKRENHRFFVKSFSQSTFDLVKCVMEVGKGLYTARSFFLICKNSRST